VTLLDTIALGDGPRPLVDERLSMMAAPDVSVLADQLSDALVGADARSGAETGAA
jgi:hypothetical protein